MISALYQRRTGDNPEAKSLLRRLQIEGFDELSELRIERVFRLEGITEEDALLLKPLFSHPSAETITTHSTLNENEGPIIEVGYQRAVTDPELPSILRASAALGVKNLVWVRIAHRYQFIGVNETTAQKIVKRYLYNSQVQVIISPGEKWDTLKPQGKAGPVEKIDIQKLTHDELVQLSEKRRLFLNMDQMTAIQKISQKMGRALTDAEIEMFAQSWSDHCFHTTWKSLGLLQALWDATNQINHPLVLSVFEDNAGAVKFYDGWALTIKGETHNSPTAVSPYGGIMTKHGGVIRDTLGCGQGAWPIGGTTIMGLGNPQMDWSDVPRGALHPKTILLESIRGTTDYTNPMGIPMMFPIYRFHNGYTGKCFALGHSIGIIPEKRAKKGHPKPGDFVILIGGPTGRDGLHGATVSSDSMTSKTATVDAAHVQIGHPIEERKFMEAIPVLRDSDCLRAITDLGAAGLSSAAGEMGQDTGVWINLALVPLKTEGMRPWEIWISESQERMLLCVPPEKHEEAMTILERYEVPAAIIGKFTDTGRCQVIFDGSKSLDPENLPLTPKLTGAKVVDLDFKDLRKSCPLPRIGIKKPEKKQADFSAPLLESQDQWLSAIKSILSHLNICDQSPAGTQFDSTVQGITAFGPYGGENGKMPNDIWVSTPIRGKPFGPVAAVGFNPFYGEIDPEAAAKLAIIEPVTKLIAAGVKQEDIVLCDNFYTPKVTPEIAWTLKKMVAVCCNISRKFGTPFISGKDSSSGTFVGEDGKRLDIPPTLAVMALGRTPDVKKLISKPWKKAGNKLFIIGPLSSNLGGSIYLDRLNQKGNKLPDPSPENIKKLWHLLRPMQEGGTILSASAISEGGLIRRLFEMGMGSRSGCRVDLTELTNRLEVKNPSIGLFAEMIGAILIEVEEKDSEKVINDLNGVFVGEIVEDYTLTINTGSIELSVSMEELVTTWEKPFREVLAK